jgi:hypothetical protein
LRKVTRSRPRRVLSAICSPLRISPGVFEEQAGQ